MVVIILHSSQWFMIGTVIVLAIARYHNIVDHWLPQLCLLSVVFINSCVVSSCVREQLCWLTVVLIHQESNLVLLFFERSSIRSKWFILNLNIAILKNFANFLKKTLVMDSILPKLQAALFLYLKIWTLRQN